MYIRISEVDNPGGGDCGFYSLAVGLIPFLQEELANRQSSQNSLLEKLLPFADHTPTFQKKNQKL